jgi:electron transfer flavoprotein beta subunit
VDERAYAIDGGQLTGTHDVDAGKESFALALPAVVTTQQGLNDPRYPTLPNIMKAKRKEMRRLPLADLWRDVAKLKVLSTEVQVKERKRKMLDGKDAAVAAAQLVDLLRNEARVI